eukprot:COSAG06_NODE_52231_length_307_cov_0.596154_1_plen_30_part_10
MHLFVCIFCLWDGVAGGGLGASRGGIMAVN